MWIFPLFMLVIFEGVADVLSKEYSLRGGPLYWCLAIAGYIVANSFWLYSIRHGSGLARGAILFSVGSAIIAVLIGALRYQEKIGRVGLIGILVGFVSIILIFWSDVEKLLKR